LGCSGFKDLLESGKLQIHDEQTILEVSTFVSKGISYEASEGNHDDLVMNLVLFGYFATGTYFAQMTDINLKEMMYKQRMEEIEQDVVPFGFVDDASEYIESLETEEEFKDKDWHIPFEFEGWENAI